MTGDLPLDDESREKENHADAEENNRRPVSGRQFLPVGVLGGYIINVKRQGLVMGKEGAGHPGRGDDPGQHDHRGIFRAPSDGQYDPADDPRQGLRQEDMGDILQFACPERERCQSGGQRQPLEGHLGGADDVGQHQKSQGDTRDQQAGMNGAGEKSVQEYGCGKAEQADDDGRQTCQDVEKEIQERLCSCPGILRQVDSRGHPDGNRPADGKDNERQGADHGGKQSVEDMALHEQGVEWGSGAEDQGETDASPAVHEEIADNRDDRPEKHDTAKPGKYQHPRVLQSSHRAHLSLLPPSRRTAITKMVVKR